MEEARKRIHLGSRLFVDDDVREDIECEVRGFNREGEPILQPVKPIPLVFHSSPRHVLDYPWNLVRTEQRPLSLPDAVHAALEALRPSTMIPSSGFMRAMQELARSLRATQDKDIPF